jgi:hypothetical protein
MFPKSRSSAYTVGQLVALLFAALISVGSLARAALSVGIDHDMTQPTFGLEGKTGSTIKYDNQNGLNLGGTISDLLGPPIRMANGFGNLIKGSNMATMGTGLKSGGALLGFDAKVLETAGAGNLLSSQLLMNAAQAKKNAAGEVAGPKGQKIASIIEIPVKVVAMKDLAEGKAFTALGAAKAAGANQMTNQGTNMLNEGQALKAQGINQIFQGASQGVQNIGNMVQKTTDNMNTAFRLLPLIWDMQQQDAAAASTKGQQQLQQQQVAQQQQVTKQERPVSTPYQMSSPTGGSFFGGLASLIPGLSSSALQGNHGFGAGPNPSYAAVWNTTSPLTNLLMNPSLNPFLMPLTTGPFGQAIVAKQPIGTPEASNANGGAGPKGGLLTSGAGSQSYDFSLLPGVRYRETVSAAVPSKFSMSTRPGGDESVSKTSQHAQQQQQQQQQQVQQTAPASNKNK